MTYGTESDIACLKSVHESLKDPNNYLENWKFDNIEEGFICQFTGVECLHPNENRVSNLKLSNMGLKGEFPQGIRNCTSLTGLDFSLNSLSKTISDDISILVNFVLTLDPSSNDFPGSIPVSLSNCTYLNSLKLDQNQLAGQIPPEFASLTRLKTFSVSNYLLSGPVPNFKPSLIPEESFANNSALCGRPLKACTTSSKTNTAVIAGAAVGGVTLAALVVAVGSCLIYAPCFTQEKGKDPEGNS
ncbi:putative inactive LRR receptor-like protein kinase [Trifolium pratense]|uniref:Putative inactive LRR receptor-like protein kinase n=1 Tax=Trifolium pratense TaxID=57577 RepID=A0A2K3N448_TRIPR|nr:putative inactive LRR receptor-like protein kinase [Trifolium pratense]